MRTWLQSTFLSGLVVLAPIGLTFYILNGLVSSADGLLDSLPGGRQLVHFPGAGLVFAFIVVMLAGFVVRNFFGRMLLSQVNRVVERIPVVATLYKLFRQISETFLGGGNKGFKRVVLVEWPRTETWTLAFVTSELKGPLAAALGGDLEGPLVNLFVPTTPNPTSGFYFITSEKQCRPTTLTVEQAFKTIISGGALTS